MNKAYSMKHLNAFKNTKCKKKKKKDDKKDETKSHWDSMLWFLFTVAKIESENFPDSSASVCFLWGLIHYHM